MHALPNDDLADRPAKDDPLSLEVAELLGRAVRRLHRGTTRALEPLGLSRGQARVVRLLDDGPLRMSIIAERLFVVPRTVTDLVDGVEVAGLVTRVPDAGDRRSTLVALTPAGRELLGRLEAARCESAAELCRGLTHSQCEELLVLLRPLADGCACAPGAEAVPAPRPASVGTPGREGSTR